MCQAEKREHLRGIVILKCHGQGCHAAKPLAMTGERGARLYCENVDSRLRGNDNMERFANPLKNLRGLNSSAARLPKAQVAGIIFMGVFVVL